MRTTLNKKIQQREYRPWQYLYMPIYFYALRNMIRTGKATYVYDANPGMPPTGILKFSKRHILKQLDDEFIPKTLFIKANSTINEEEIRTFVDTSGSYPIIAKPDLGERGTDVVLINNENELFSYIYRLNVQDLLIQEFIDYKLELGIMYYRFPDKDKGTITGVTIKEFFEVIGDGTSSIRTLVENHPRGSQYNELLSTLHGSDFDKVLSQGESKILNHIGNHNKGTKFLDGSEIINDTLIDVIDGIAKSIDGFYYGRFDLKVKSIDDLYLGKTIKILEVNGIQSEPAHMYDPNTSIIDGYKELFKHWIAMYKISKINRKNNNLKESQNLWENLFDQMNLMREQKKVDNENMKIHSFEELEIALDKNIQRQKKHFGNISLFRCKHILGNYVGNDRKEHVTYKKHAYTKNQISHKHGSTDFSIHVIGREGDYMSDIHDHPDHGCIMKVMQGELVEKMYNRNNDGTLIENKKSIISKGETTFIRDDIGYHSLGTNTPQRGVSIHVYSPALYTPNYFSKTLGKKL